MAINKSQLEIWAKQGAVSNSKNTFQSIQTLIYKSNLSSKYLFKIYLQGSYRNFTNIRGDSDIDIVIELVQNYKHKDNCLEALSYLFEPITFRKDILDLLIQNYSLPGVVDGNKSIKVLKGHTPLGADVVVCKNYYYNKFEGIQLITKNYNEQIINFPIMHYNNGVIKSKNTNDAFKETVRIFKNATQYLIKKMYIRKDLAPSYFIECLLFNVPNDNFQYEYEKRFKEIIKWFVNLINNGKQSSLLCQNFRQPLFGQFSTQWKVDSAKELFYNFNKMLV